MILWPTQTLIASALLYSASHCLDWSISAYPKGLIYFNPVNWQLLYVIGMWWGISPSGKQPRILKSPVLAGVAVVYLLLSFFITLGWRFHSLEAYVPRMIADSIYPIEKGDLDVLRLIHFLALALLCWRIIPRGLSPLTARFLRPLVQCGEYSLAIYCISVLLSFAAHAILSTGWNNLALQTMLFAAGLAILAAVAGFIARVDQAGRAHPRTL